MEGDFEHLYSSEGSRLVDREAINSLQLAEGELMERAGAAAYGVICRRWPGISTLNVVCGPGNNGGDGYIVARLAHEAGIKVRVCQVVSPKTDDAQRALEQLNLRGVTVEPANIETIGEAELVVDAVLGTGLSRLPSGVFRTEIQAINASGRPVLALDCPSGLDMDTGWTGGAAVQATVTVTFICLKGGLLTGRAPDLTGDIVVECLEVPAAVLTNVEPMACCISARIVQERLPARRRTMHKGEAGHLVVIGGDVSMTGAPQLAGTAALRTGAGLVTIATRHSSMDPIGRGQPELMCHPVEDQLSLETVLAGKTAVVVGPGLGQSQWGVEMLSAVLASGLPGVVDADALNLLAQAPRQTGEMILTPHPGEASRLLNTDIDAIQSQRFVSATKIRSQYGGICVLKGTGTLVATEGGNLWLCKEGNPGMATAGMGDVLAGIIGALLCQGLVPGDAAIAGVWLHSRAADLAAADGGERGLLASDLWGYLRRLVNDPYSG